MATNTASLPSFGRRQIVVTAGALALIVLGVITFLALRDGGTAAPSTTPPPAKAPPPITLSSSDPATGTALSSALAPITLIFSEPLAKTANYPTVTGATGSWTTVNRHTIAFHPSENYTPYAPVTVTIGAASSGPLSSSGGAVVAPVTLRFTGESATMLRLQQLLAELNYLPLAFNPSALAQGGGLTALTAEPTDPGAISTTPEAGTFSWKFARIPHQLAVQWQAGGWNLLTKGAVMAFEADHNLTIDGEPGAAVWGAVLSAVATRQATTRPYDFLIATETIPETLYVWQDGKVILQTPANTGVSGASTPLGTWPVYLRFTSTTMSGQNPDGSHYSDPGVPWVSYFNGSDAVHGFVRSVYGVPQSDGCVEIPIDTAKSVFPLDPIGTLVTITTGNLSAELDAAPAQTIGSFAPSTPTTTTVPATTTTVPATTTTLASRRPTTTTSAPSPTTTLAPPTSVTGTSG